MVLLSDALIDADLDLMFADLGQEVTYRRRMATVFVPKSGTHVEAWEETELTAIPRIVSAAEVAHAAGVLRVGDQAFLIRTAELAERPSLSGQVMWGAETYQLVAWDCRVQGRLYRIVGRRG